VVVVFQFCTAFAWKGHLRLVRREGEIMSSPAMGMESKESAESAIEGSVDSSQIAALAYEYWQRRGCPIGSPELDWFQAEVDLLKRTDSNREAKVGGISDELRREGSYETHRKSESKTGPTKNVQTQIVGK
jgi:hypothetical protein